MLTNKQFSDIEKNGIRFELSKNGKYATVYKRNKFVSTIYDTKNTVYFCGREFVETTTKEIIEYLRNLTNN